MKELPFSEGDGMGYPFLLSSQEDDSNAEGQHLVWRECFALTTDRLHKSVNAQLAVDGAKEQNCHGWCV